MLVTGGTVFVSRRIAEFFCTSGNEVFVLNRNTRAQVPGVQLIQADRHSLVPDSLSGYDFDVVIDVCAYREEDARILSSALGKNFSGEFIFISSSAVYRKQTYSHSLKISSAAQILCGAITALIKYCAKNIILLFSRTRILSVRRVCARHRLNCVVMHTHH